MHDKARLGERYLTAILTHKGVSDRVTAVLLNGHDGKLVMQPDNDTSRRIGR